MISRHNSICLTVWGLAYHWDPWLSWIANPRIPQIKPPLFSATFFEVFSFRQLSCKQDIFSGSVMQVSAADYFSVLPNKQTNKQTWYLSRTPWKTSVSNISVRCKMFTFQGYLLVFSDVFRCKFFITIVCMCKYTLENTLFFFNFQFSCWIGQFKEKLFSVFTIFCFAQCTYPKHFIPLYFMKTCHLWGKISWFMHGIIYHWQLAYAK